MFSTFYFEDFIILVILLRAFHVFVCFKDSIDFSFLGFKVSYDYFSSKILDFESSSLTIGSDALEALKSSVGSSSMLLDLSKTTIDFDLFISLYYFDILSLFHF